MNPNRPHNIEQIPDELLKSPLTAGLIDPSGRPFKTSREPALQLESGDLKDFIRLSPEQEQMLSAMSEDDRSAWVAQNHIILSRKEAQTLAGMNVDERSRALFSYLTATGWTPPGGNLNASEAVWGFAAFMAEMLSEDDEETDSSMIQFAGWARDFCEVNSTGACRDGWEANMKAPDYEAMEGSDEN